MRITASINGTEHILDLELLYSDDDDAVAGVPPEFTCHISGENIAPGIYSFTRTGMNESGHQVFSATLITPDSMPHRVNPQPQLALT